MKREIKLKAILEKEKAWRVVHGYDRLNGLVLVLISCEYEWRKFKKILQYTDLNDCNDIEIYEGNTIEFRYEDTQEDGGFGYCRGVVIYEDGCFVCKEEGFDYKKEKAMTLFEWITDNPCYIVK